MYRLMYKSKVVDELNKETFRDILYTSARKNMANGITGALLATRSHYMQVLEGERDHINETFDRISVDPRHCDVEIIVFRRADERLFTRWEMRGFGIFDLNKELDGKLKQSFGEENGSVMFPVEEKAALSLLHEIQLIEEARIT